MQQTSDGENLIVGFENNRRGQKAQAENTINPVPGNPEGAPEPQHGTEKPQQSAIDEGGVQHQGEHHKPQQR